jgi:phosphoribosylanthranilate isomerase
MLQKPLVYVSRITNLSDARYCAGMGVDILGFSINPAHEDYVSPMSYQEMVGWISGPRRAVEIPAGSKLNWEQVIDEYKPDLIHITYSITENVSLPDLPVVLELTFKELLAHGERLNRLDLNLELVIITELPDTATKKEMTIDPHPVLLYLEKDIPSLEDLLGKTGAAGFALRGTREHSPGLKDYDHLSKILEALDKEG